MPNIALTDNLRETIRSLRKKQKIRGDELSKELGKGASYISPIESGKIKEIDFNLLNNIFHKVTNLSGSEYNEFIKDLLDNNISHMTNEELQHEKWIIQFNHEIRKFPITDSLIKFIRSSLEELHYTPEEFVEYINQNIDAPNINVSESNKLYIDVTDIGNGSLQATSYIRFNLPSDFIQKILSKETKTINYINMEGILFYIYLANGLPAKEAHEKATRLLYDNQFYTIEERNKLIQNAYLQKKSQNEDFTIYDLQPTDLDKQYTKLRQQINSGFSAMRDKNITYACEKLELLIQNMHYDLGLVFALFSSPLYKLNPKDKMAFWNDYKDLLFKYIAQNSNNETFD